MEFVWFFHLFIENELFFGGNILVLTKLHWSARFWKYPWKQYMFPCWFSWLFFCHSVELMVIEKRQFCWRCGHYVLSSSWRHLPLGDVQFNPSPSRKNIATPLWCYKGACRQELENIRHGGIVKGHVVASRTRSKSKKGGKYSHAIQIHSLKTIRSSLLHVLERMNRSKASLQQVWNLMTQILKLFSSRHYKRKKDRQEMPRRRWCMPCEPQRWQLIGARHCDPKLIN